MDKRVQSGKQFERCARYLTTTTRALLLRSFPIQSRTRRHASLVSSMCSVFLGAASSISCDVSGGRRYHTVVGLVASSCKTFGQHSWNPWRTFPGRGCRESRRIPIFGNMRLGQLESSSRLARDVPWQCYIPQLSWL